MKTDHTIDGRDWPVYRCELSATPIKQANVYGKYVVGPGGCCEVVRCEAGHWLVCNAFDRYCREVKLGGMNGRLDYQFAMRMARRIARYGSFTPPMWAHS